MTQTTVQRPQASAPAGPADPFESERFGRGA